MTNRGFAAEEYVLRHHAQLNLPSENQWILQDIIPADGLVVLASAPKTGKTVFVNAIARAMASGGKFAGLGWKQKIPVAWCAHEETTEERGPLLAGLGPDDPFHLAFARDLISLDDPDCDEERDRFGRYRLRTRPYVYEEAASLGCGLLVIDCLHAAVRHTNLSDNQAARRIMGKLRHWSNQFKVATVVLHHLTKSAHRGYHPERFADSAQILAGASCHFYLESVIYDDGTRKVVLHGAGRQPAPPVRQEYLAHSLFDYEYVPATSTARQLPTVGERIAALLQEGWELTAEEIARRLEANPKTVRNALAELPNVERSDAPKRRARYRHALAARPEP